MRSLCTAKKKNFQCEFCGKYYTWKRSLEEHKKLKHQVDRKLTINNPVPTITCPCDNCHTPEGRRKKGKKEHPCYCCKKSFNRPCLLIDHMTKIHPTLYPKEENVAENSTKDKK